MSIIKCLKKLETDDPLGFNTMGLYEYKFKKFLSVVALGMKPAKKWDGLDEATGGYIIISDTGDVLVFYLYNRNNFENYLFNNTVFESASATRHNYGYLYKEDNKLFFDLNLQIRFKNAK